jgi:hypothetical protein
MEVTMAFVRVVKTKSSTGEIQKYVRVVENRRERGRSVQHVIANMGNVKVLKKDIKKIVNGLLRAVGERPMVAVEDWGASCTLVSTCINQSNVFQETRSERFSCATRMERRLGYMPR